MQTGHCFTFKKKTKKKLELSQILVSGSSPQTDTDSHCIIIKGHFSNQKHFSVGYKAYCHYFKIACEIIWCVHTELGLDPEQLKCQQIILRLKNHSLVLWLLLGELCHRHVKFLCPQTILFFSFPPTPVSLCETGSHYTVLSSL